MVTYFLCFANLTRIDSKKCVYTSKHCYLLLQAYSLCIPREDGTYNDNPEELFEKSLSNLGKCFPQVELKSNLKYIHPCHKKSVFC